MMEIVCGRLDTSPTLWGVHRKSDASRQWSSLPRLTIPQDLVIIQCDAIVKGIMVPKRVSGGSSWDYEKH